MVWPRGALRPGRRPSRPRGRRLRGRLHRRRIRRQFEPDGARGIVQVHLRFRTRGLHGPHGRGLWRQPVCPGQPVWRGRTCGLHPRVELDVQRRWPVRRSHVAPATHRRRFVRAGGRAERASDASVGAHGAHLRVQTSAGCGGLPRTRGLRGPADVGVPGQTLCLEERRNGLHRVVGLFPASRLLRGAPRYPRLLPRHLWVRLTRERVVLADRRHDVHHVRLLGYRIEPTESRRGTLQRRRKRPDLGHEDVGLGRSPVRLHGECSEHGIGLAGSVDGRDGLLLTVIEAIPTIGPFSPA